MNQSQSIDNNRHNRISSAAPAGQATLHNLIVSSSMTALKRNRSSSEPDMLRATRRKHHSHPAVTTSSFPTGVANANSVFFSPDADAHRSVQTLVPAIAQRCQEEAMVQSVFHLPNHHSSAPAVMVIPPPEEECYLLAYWALADNYNKAVICAMGGVEAVLRAMQTFPNSAGLQECGCLVLGNLARDSTCHARTVERAGGVEQILHAAKLHPSSVAVQSAVCDALQNILTFDDEEEHTDTTSLTNHHPISHVLETSRTELLNVLFHASSMVLSNNQHKAAEQLLAKTLMMKVDTSTNDGINTTYSPVVSTGRLTESEFMSALIQNSLY